MRIHVCTILTHIESEDATGISLKWVDHRKEIQVGENLYNGMQNLFLIYIFLSTHIRVHNYESGLR